MTINTHGIKMTGLKAVSGETKDLGGYYSGQYVEIFYDRSTGKVWGNYQYSLGQNTWTVYDDPDVIKICNASDKMTMQQIADAVSAHLQEIAEREAWEVSLEREELGV